MLLQRRSRFSTGCLHGHTRILAIQATALRTPFDSKMHGDGDSSDIEFMLPPPLNGRASSNAPLPKRPAAISSSQPVFIEIDDTDDDQGNGAGRGSGMEDTPPRLAIPQPRAALHKTVSAPAVFPATTGASTSYRGATTSRHGSNAREDGDESDDLPDIGMADIANKRNKGKGRAVETAVALTDTEEEKSSSDEEPAKKKRKAQGTGKKAGGSGSDNAGLSKAEQKKLDATGKKKAKDQEKKEKAVSPS